MKRFCFALAPLACLLLATPAEGGLFRRWARSDCYQLRAPCDVAGDSCAAEAAGGAGMVQVWDTETVTVPCVEYRPEERQRTVTRYRRVPEVKEVTRTVTVPHYEERTKTVHYTEWRTEYDEVEREYQVRVPHRETRTGTRNVCEWVSAEETRTVMVPERRTRTVERPVCRTVWHDETKSYTVCVPYQETVSATRRVCEWVNVTRTKTVTEDHGSWEEVAVAAGCGHEGCSHETCIHESCSSEGGATRIVRKWVPNLVQREVEYQARELQTKDVPYEKTVTRYRKETRERTVRVPEVVRETETREVPCIEMVPQERTVTVKKPQMKEVTFEYPVTVYTTETRTRTDRVCKRIPEEKTREVTYRVCVPKQETRTYQVTTYRCEPYEETVTETVMVPHHVEKRVTRRVMKWVPSETAPETAAGGVTESCCAE